MLFVCVNGMNDIRRELEGILFLYAKLLFVSYMWTSRAVLYVFVNGMNL